MCLNMNASVTKWMKTNIAGTYEKCSNGNIANGNHVLFEEVVNVSSIKTSTSSTSSEQKVTSDTSRAEGALQVNENTKSKWGKTFSKNTFRRVYKKERIIPRNEVGTHADEVILKDVSVNEEENCDLKPQVVSAVRVTGDSDRVNDSDTAKSDSSSKANKPLTGGSDSTENDVVDGDSVANRGVAVTVSDSCKKRDDNSDDDNSDDDSDNSSDDSSDDHNSKVKTQPHLDGLNICQYKLKCMALDQNEMNHSKVHVDESEPSGHEEAPFEPRDVKIRNGCWTDEYEVSDILLGRGKFGEVKQCKERKTGRDFAAKFIQVNGPQDRFDVQNEIEMMKCLQHPRLLQLYDVFTKKNNFCLVLELISGGELFERVINDDFILTEKACIMFMRQICEGIEFMHNNSIIHLDLKPENILCLTREGNRIKIIDFGLARRYKPGDDLRILYGTPEFMAPEQANFEPIFPSTDMWSVGIICYILLSGLSPFLGESETETIANITEAKWDFKAEEFESISAEAKDFISKLILKDQSKRMTATECLEHKWLRRSAKRERIPTRSLSTKRLKKFVYRRKWQKAVNAMLALKRMGVKL